MYPLYSCGKHAWKGNLFEYIKLSNLKYKIALTKIFMELLGTRGCIEKPAIILWLDHLKHSIYVFLASVTRAMEDKNSYANRKRVLFECCQMTVNIIFFG